jgi:hypothetical protein
MIHPARAFIIRDPGLSVVNSSRFGLSADDSKNRSARFVKPQSEPPKFGHNMPVTLDGGARPWR